MKNCGGGPILAPDHPVLNTPNKIPAEDFKGWSGARTVFSQQMGPTVDAILYPMIPGEKPMDRRVAGRESR